MQRCFRFAVLALAVFALAAATGDRQVQTLHEARNVFHELMSQPDAQIPATLLHGCKAIAIFSGVIKGAFAIGVRRGHGVVSSRGARGAWSPPAFMTLTGGSVGWQIGIEKADVVLFLMSEKSVRSLLEITPEKILLEHAAPRVPAAAKEFIAALP